MIGLATMLIESLATRALCIAGKAQTPPPFQSYETQSQFLRSVQANVASVMYSFFKYKVEQIIQRFLQVQLQLSRSRALCIAAKTSLKSVDQSKSPINFRSLGSCIIIVNGSFACENDKMLNGILKTEYGFQGCTPSPPSGLNSAHRLCRCHVR